MPGQFAFWGVYVDTFLHLWKLPFLLLLTSSLQSLFTFLPSELFYDRGNHHNFISLVKSLSPPGALDKSATFSFDFMNAEKPHETYTGTNVRLRSVKLMETLVWNCHVYRTETPV